MFSESQKKVFTYHDGEKEVHADPLTIRRKFYTDPDFSHERDGKLVQVACDYLANMGKEGNEGLKKAAQEGQAATDRMLAAIRRAFSIKPLGVDNGKTVGLNEDELIALLNRFFDFWPKSNPATKN